jgi:hypothetical protein
MRRLEWGYVLSSRNAATADLANTPPAARTSALRDRDDLHVGRFMVDADRLRMTGDGRKAGWLRRLAQRGR